MGGGWGSGLDAWLVGCGLVGCEPQGVVSGGWVWFVNSGREHLVAIREVKLALAGDACASFVVWCVWLVGLFLVLCVSCSFFVVVFLVECL